MPKGFQLSPIMQYGSARPYNLTNSSNTLNTGGGSFNAVVVPTSDPTNYLAFSPSNFGNSSSLANKAAQNCFYGLNGVPQACTIAQYDPLRGDPFFELDLRLSKNIKIKEPQPAAGCASVQPYESRQLWQQLRQQHCQRLNVRPSGRVYQPGQHHRAALDLGEFGFRLTF